MLFGSIIEICVKCTRHYSERHCGKTGSCWGGGGSDGGGVIGRVGFRLHIIQTTPYEQATGPPLKYTEVSLNCLYLKH